MLKPYLFSVVLAVMAPSFHWHSPFVCVLPLASYLSNAASTPGVPVWFPENHIMKRSFLGKSHGISNIHDAFWNFLPSEPHILWCDLLVVEILEWYHVGFLNHNDSSYWIDTKDSSSTTKNPPQFIRRKHWEECMQSYPRYSKAGHNLNTRDPSHFLYPFTTCVYISLYTCMVYTWMLPNIKVSQNERWKLWKTLLNY